MKKPFKVGERVAVYHGAARFVGHIKDIRNGTVLVEESYGESQFWHPKQCRRLVSKEKRRVWVEKQGYIFSNLNSLNLKEGERVEFIEVKKSRLPPLPTAPI